MRIYRDEKETELVEVICNSCGRKLLVEGGIVKEGCFHMDTVFGYFSRKDGQIHSFDLCEDCYDKMTAQFRIPVEEKEARELL